MFKKSQRVPPFTFFGTMLLTGDLKKSKKMEFFSHSGTVEENTWHFEVLLLFLSLKYGADLVRSRLVSILWHCCICCCCSDENGFLLVSDVGCSGTVPTARGATSGDLSDTSTFSGGPPRRKAPPPPPKKLATLSTEDALSSSHLDMLKWVQITVFTSLIFSLNR